MKSCALAFIVAAGLIQTISVARADDYNNGYDAAKNGYYGGAPDNNSSADYTQGYQRGQYQQQQQNYNNNNNE